ncbi:mRNA cap guanine-N7 methyltransferase-like [Ctenocephalides felis]|uniref:mRNA cap guanine-N7 methyltransferase-like n=1 Tax=Ctenocephalides felis TaxID=7515 RepID=UPI000E6E2E8C|nr:mRNA cap guanine-N7 methyltransferase-like [Ctenocephalides felis]
MSNVEDPEDCISLDDALASLVNDEKDETDDEVLKIQDTKGRVSVIKDVECNKILKRPLTPSSDNSNDAEKRLKTDESEVKDEQSNFIYNPDSMSNLVANHYNKIEEIGLNARTKTRIYFMRNFNNWIKSMLISQYIEKVTSNKVGVPLRVLDMCCGKGGDLYKWQKSKITHLICADIADVSVDQCKTRYEDLKAKNDNSRFPKLFTAEFIASDCTLIRLREQYQDPSVSLDLVSCQFAFHYCFETLPQAERMLQNASECLRPGGYFIGTIPNANEIMARKQACGASSFGNEVYNIEFQFDDSNKVPLFGAKYLFQLEGVVNCPEFLVHFPTLVKLAKKYGLELESKETFEELFERVSPSNNGAYMLTKIQALETYPAFANSSLSGAESEYEHAKNYYEKTHREKKFQKIGTLSKSEWEAISLYMTFAFKKVKTTWNSEGKPEYK